MRPVLHIFNGDCAANAWKKIHPAATRYLVWRENYLEGPLPAATTPREEFARIRAEFLHTCVPQYSVETLTAFQIGLEKTLAELTAEDAVMLWFDECMFDMLMLSRILFLLEHTPAELRLCCENRVLGAEAEFFRSPLQSFRKLSPETVALYADAWRAVSTGGAALTALTASGRLTPETALARALARYAADHPTDGGWGLSERKLLALITGGINDFAELFHAFNASEARPFMGDTMCERMLQRMVLQGLLTVSGDARRYFPTEKALAMR